MVMLTRLSLARLLVFLRSESKYIAYNIILVIALGFMVSITATMAPHLFTGPTQMYIIARLREIYGISVNTLDEVPKPLLISIIATDLTPMLALLIISSAVATSVARYVEKYRVHGMFERIIPNLGLAGPIRLLLGYGILSALVSVGLIIIILLLIVIVVSIYYNVEIKLSEDYVILLTVLIPSYTLFSVGIGLTVSLGLMNWKRVERPSEIASISTIVPPLITLILTSLGFTNPIRLLVAISLIGIVLTFTTAMILTKRIKIANIIY